MEIEVKNATWHEAKVKYECENDKGIEEKVTENYVIDAGTCTEAESLVMEELKNYTNIKVTKTCEAAYREVLCNMEADKFWKVKVQIVILDESSEKEKRTNLQYLVQAKDIADAMRVTKEYFSNSVSDYAIVGINETKIKYIID